MMTIPHMKKQGQRDQAALPRCLSSGLRLFQ